MGTAWWSVIVRDWENQYDSKCCMAGGCWMFRWLGDSWACNKARWTLDFKWRSETSRSVSWQQKMENFRKATFIKSKGTPWGEDLKPDCCAHTDKLETAYLENRAWKVFGWLSEWNSEEYVLVGCLPTNQSGSQGSFVRTNSVESTSSWTFSFWVAGRWLGSVNQQAPGQTTVYSRKWLARIFLYSLFHKLRPCA